MGFDVFTTEDFAGWTAFLRSLVARRYMTLESLAKAKQPKTGEDQIIEPEDAKRIAA